MLTFPSRYISDGSEVDLTKQVERVRHGILAHLRNWSESFPEPTHGAFPVDFNEMEKKKIRAHVASYLTLQGLLEDKESIEATTTHLLNDASFPVAKGKHRAAIQAAVKEQYSDFAKRAKKRKQKAAKRAERLGDQEDDDDDGDGDGDGPGAAAGSSDNEERGRPTSRRRTASPESGSNG